VLVVLTPQARTDANGFYGSHVELSERLYRRYTLPQLELLLQFVREGREFNDQQATIVEERNRAERG
jgi:hypothetical protein